jgi:RNA cap guanine-N2 methyltransferase
MDQPACASPARACPPAPPRSRLPACARPACASPACASPIRASLPAPAASRQPPLAPARPGRDDGPVSQAAQLLTPAGAELLGRLRGIDVTPDQALCLGTELRDRYPPDLVAAALTQQALRMAAREKFGLADEMFFTRDGLEQASGEQAAAHTARRFAGLTLAADLCCGIGGDLTALATATRQVLAVDADFDNLQFATRNAAVYGSFGAVSAVCGDVRDLRLAGVPAAFIDPARRASGHRLRAGESHPPLSWCFALADQVPRVCVKAAPGLAHALVPEGWEMEFVAVGRNLKEALLWSPGFATTTRRATILPAEPLANAVDAAHPATPEPDDAGRRTPVHRDAAYRQIEATRWRPAHAPCHQCQSPHPASTCSTRTRL